MIRYRYRQLFLFLMVLLVPALAIVVQGRWVAAGDRELAEKRSEDVRKRAATEFGQNVFSQLERIKIQEISGVLTGTISGSAGYSDPAVVFVGWEENDHLVLPWDVERHTSQPRTAVEAEWAQKISEAERAEFGDKDYSRAAALYREAIDAAPSEQQKASARLLLGRALSRSGATAQALGIYRELMSLPTTIADDYGLSFNSYAAARMMELNAAGPDVVDSMKRELASPALLRPTQAYRVRSILEALQKSGDARILADAKSAMALISERIDDLEQAQDVQKEFQKLSVTTDAWLAYEKKSLWWIGKARARDASRPLILAIRVEDIRKRVEADMPSHKDGATFQITTNMDRGEPLGPRLAGLSVLPRIGDANAVGGSRLSSIYGLSLFCVGMLSAFFLWRDTRRESRIAELRSQFVSSVSHELKTPLTSIRMFAETLQMNDGNDSTDPKMRAEYLDTIVSETERLTRLLNNVLDFSRIERGQKNYHMESALLPDVIDAAVRTMRFPLAEQGFALKVDVCEGIPALRIDRDAIEQAVLNLLSNAMKYSGKSRDIELRLCRQNGSALIQVFDHGIGIPADEQRHIFEKFYRVPTNENKTISGTGLGLALVAHIAEAHGGSVDVNSKPGEGSTFSIRIPVNGDDAS
jgi:tetratricopeptide (TPR) repeat protein/anti-sigma regulatory factor (Ser/Thr protein kinase)